MEREACVRDHGFERSELCAEIVIIMMIITVQTCANTVGAREEHELTSCAWVKLVFSICDASRREGQCDRVAYND